MRIGLPIVLARELRQKNGKNIHFQNCVLNIGLAVVHIKMINDVIFFIECILLNINCSGGRERGVK